MVVQRVAEGETVVEMNLRNSPSGGTVTGMTRLMRLIRAHLDRYGVTQAEFARRVGTSPQTVQNWRDEIRALPDAKHLHGVAEVIGVPYVLVLEAVLTDAGYLDSDIEDAASLEARMRRAVGAAPAVLDDLWFAVNRLKAERDLLGEVAPPSDTAESRAAADLIARMLSRGLDGDDSDNSGHQAG